VTPIETPRLRLRKMTGEDLDFVAAMLGDPLVMRYYPKVLSRDEAREWIVRQRKRYADDGHGLWLLERRRDGEPIGQVGLVMQEIDGAREPEIGYMIHSGFWRRGYATEAALAVREAAFGHFRYEHVISLIRAENMPSQGVARRLGMVPVRETLFRSLPHSVFQVSRDAAGRIA